MDMITVSAKTFDEAITKALIELQTTSEHLHYEVVQKESSGILGIFGAKPCILRAKVMTEQEEKAAKEEAVGKKAIRQEEVKKEPVKAENTKKEAPKKEFTKRENPKQETYKKEPVKAETLEKKVEPEDKSAEVKVEKAPSKVNEEVVKKAAKEFLEKIFGAMKIEVEIETTYDASERELLVLLNGEDMGILIGKRGQTLDSLQYLVSLVVNKETEGYLRVKLDTENYRERRKETLETLARNISYKVKRTKHPVSLEPMNPYERRIIHSALQNDKYVVTRSEGEDPYRHVVISLKNDRYSNGRRDHYYNKKDRNRQGERPVVKPEEATEVVE